MATRKRMGFRPRKATRRMVGKSTKRTRKNVMTGGSKPPPPPPPPKGMVEQQKQIAPAGNRSSLLAEIQGGFKLKSVNKSAPQQTRTQDPIKQATRRAPVNISTGTPNKGGASGVVNTSSGVRDIRGQINTLEALIKPAAPRKELQQAALQQAAAEKAGNAPPNPEAIMAKVRSQGVSVFGANPSTMLKPAQPVTVEQLKSSKPVVPTSTGPAKVALLPPNIKQGMAMLGIIQNNKGNFKNSKGRQFTLARGKFSVVRPQVAPRPKPPAATDFSGFEEEEI